MSVELNGIRQSVVRVSWRHVEGPDCNPSWSSLPSPSVPSWMSVSTSRGTGWGGGQGVRGENSVHIPKGQIESFTAQEVKAGVNAVSPLGGWEAAPQLAEEGWLWPPCLLQLGQPHF